MYSFVCSLVYLCGCMYYLCCYYYFNTSFFYCNTFFLFNYFIYYSVLIHIYYRYTSSPGGNQVDGLPPALRGVKHSPSGLAA